MTAGNYLRANLIRMPHNRRGARHISTPPPPRAPLGRGHEGRREASHGSVATMSALVLGLLVTSVKDAYDTRKGEVIQLAAKVAFIDRVLRAYG